MKTFEQYLQDIHAEHCSLKDDDMLYNFDEWIVELNVDDWLRYATRWKSEYMIKTLEGLSN